MMVRSILAVLFAVGVLGCHGEPQVQDKRVLRVATVMPELSGSYQLQRQFVGRVNAAQRVDVGFEQGGKIDQMLANEGDAIIAGQPLARLDDRFLQVERKELEARQAELQARLQLVRSSLKRQQSLQKQGFSAEQQLDELQAEQDVLLASAQRLQAGLGSNQLQLEKSTLVAPYDGVVSHRYLDQGAVAAAGMPVFQLLESGHLEVVVGVPVTMTAGLVIGDDYAISIGPDTFAAKLLAVGSDLDAITRTVKLRLALPAQAPRDGELALLKLSESRHEAGFWLPVSALTDGMRGLWNCYVLEDVGDGRYRIAAVNAQVLHVDQERVYVAADLEGKRVVSRGLHRVAPGQIVSAGNDELAAR